MGVRGGPGEADGTWNSLCATWARRAGHFFIDFFEFLDFSKNRIFDPFFDSGGPGTVLDRSGMQKYPRGLIFSSGARF